MLKVTLDAEQFCATLTTLEPIHRERSFIFHAGGFCTDRLTILIQSWNLYSVGGSGNASLLVLRYSDSQCVVVYPFEDHIIGCCDV